MKDKETKKPKKINKKATIWVIICVVITIGALTIGIVLFNNDKKIQENTKENIILNDNLEFEVNSEIHLLDLVSVNSKDKVVSDDELIDTSALGNKDIVLRYDENGKIKEQKFTIQIVDTQAPTIEYEKELSTTAGTKIDLLKNVKVSDNSKEEIKTVVEGEYDFNKEGTYNLKYVAIDSSNNKAEEKFTLKVMPKKTSSNTNNSSNNTNPTQNNSNTSNNTTSSNSTPSNNQTNNNNTPSNNNNSSNDTDETKKISTEEKKKAREIIKNITSRYGYTLTYSYLSISIDYEEENHAFHINQDLYKDYLLKTLFTYYVSVPAKINCYTTVEKTTEPITCREDGLNISFEEAEAKLPNINSEWEKFKANVEAIKKEFAALGYNQFYLYND